MVNPDELYPLRWLLTTLGRGMYQEDPDVLPTAPPIMKHLRVVLEVIDNSNQTPSPWQLNSLKDREIIQNFMDLPLSQTARDWHNALDILTR